METPGGEKLALSPFLKPRRAEIEAGSKADRLSLWPTSSLNLSTGLPWFGQAGVKSGAIVCLRDSASELPAALEPVTVEGQCRPG